MNISNFGVVIFISLFTLSARAADEGESAINHSESACGYYFDKLPRGFVSSEKTTTTNNGVNTILVAINDAGGSRIFDFKFSCNDSLLDQESADRLMTAKQLIEEEDSGGRYFRHVSFEAKVDGLNWKGNLAFIDYQVGDNEKTKVNIYYVCQDKVSVPCFQVSPHKIRQSKKSKAEILNVLKNIGFVNMQKP